MLPLSDLLLAIATIGATVLGVWLTNRSTHNQQKLEAKARWDLLLYTLGEFPLHKHNDEEGQPLHERNLIYPKKQINNNGSGR